MGSEDQAFTSHTKKTKRDHHHSKGNISHSRRDMSTIRCYTCDEKVTYPNTALTKGTQRRKRETREDIMLMLQRMMNLPQRVSSKKVIILQVMKNMF